MTGDNKTTTNAPDTGNRADSVWTWGLAEFRDRTAEPNPAPGGGSAAMASAAIGVALIVMALRVTRDKARSDAEIADLETLISSAEDLMARVSEFADTDIEAFEGFMEALRLPKATDDEKAARNEAIAGATVVATEVPLNAAAACLEGLDLAIRAEGMVGDMIVSDVGAGANLLHGALHAVLLNVDINTRGLKDPGAKADYERSRAHLAATGTARQATVTDRMSARLA